MNVNGMLILICIYSEGEEGQVGQGKAASFEETSFRFLNWED